MAGKAYRRHLRAHESEGFDTDQQANHKAANHAKLGQPVHSSRWTGRWHLLCSRWLLEHAHWSRSIGLGEHSRWLRWRSRATEADGDRLRVLARDSMRLVILPVHFRWYGRRAHENSGTSDRCRLGMLASSRCRNEFPGHRSWPAEVCQATAGAVSGNLAGKGRESALQSDSIYRTKYGVYRPPVLPAVRSVVFRLIEHDKDSVLPFGDRRESGLVNSAILLLVVRGDAIQIERRCGSYRLSTGRVRSNSGITLTILEFQDEREPR